MHVEFKPDQSDKRTRKGPSVLFTFLAGVSATVAVSKGLALLFALICMA